MIRKATILVAVQLLALVAQTTGSEMTASLASKVAESDLVAIIKIQAVESGKIHVPHDWHSAAQDFKMHAVVIDRIKGDTPDTIVVTAYSTSYRVTSEDGRRIGMRSSTAGFSAYGIEPGKSYIAYLREDAGGQYKLGWNSNQFLEEISDDGLMVNDIGQTTDQVSLLPKVWKLSVIAFVTHPATLSSALATLAFLAIWIIRRRRNRMFQRQSTAKQEAEQVVPPND